MIMEIGIVAGEIWHYLDAKGKASLSDIASAINRPNDLVLMSLGWLAREGHVLLEGDGDYQVSLRKKDSSENKN
jgi:hypothetical protein